MLYQRYIFEMTNHHRLDILRFPAMKINLALSLNLILIITLCSCIKPKGIWEDNINLSVKTVEFSALSDSVVISTLGTSWYVSDVSVDNAWFYDFRDVNLQADSYVIKQDCFIVERRNKNKLFIKLEANPGNIQRIITVGVVAGDYGDRVTIIQKAK